MTTVLDLQAILYDYAHVRVWVDGKCIYEGEAKDIPSEFRSKEVNRWGCDEEGTLVYLK